MRTISVKIPEDLDHALSELAERRGQTRSALIREALSAHLLLGESVAPLARGLAGCLDGPEDLSSSPAHLEGYGR